MADIFNYVCFSDINFSGFLYFFVVGNFYILATPKRDSSNIHELFSHKNKKVFDQLFESKDSDSKGLKE